MGTSFFKRSLWFLLVVSIVFVPSSFAERFEARKTIDAVVEWDNGKAYFFKGSQQDDRGKGVQTNFCLLGQ